MSHAKTSRRSLTAILALAGILTPAVMAAEPFKLGVQEKGFVQPAPIQGYADYPAPHMMGQSPAMGTAAPLQGGAVARPPVVRPPIQAGIQKVQLPPDLLGVWNVSGSRMKVEAMPEFQATAEQAFATSTSNIWEINGSPGNYTMGSNTGIKTPLIVDKVDGNTAFIRYQHPIGKTMAQEAIVMNLSGGSAQFNGLERVSIVKEGMAQPRARVTYQLTGYRQR